MSDSNLRNYDEQRLEATKTLPIDNAAVRKRPDVFTVPGMTYDHPFGQSLSSLDNGQANDLVGFVVAKMGTNGDLVQSIERVGARMASAVMRASHSDISRDLQPSVLVPCGNDALQTLDDSKLLADQVLRIIGRTRYLNPDMQIAFPHVGGNNSGMMELFNKMHLPFMQSVVYLVKPTEEARLGYIHGDIDLKTASAKMCEASVQERNHAINLMIKAKKYQIIQDKGEDLKRFVEGTVPEGPLAGESIRLEIISPMILSKNARIGDKSLATMATGYAQRPEGKIYGSVAHRVIVKDGEQQKPLGHIINYETGETIDHLTTVKLAALEIVRRNSFAMADLDTQQQLTLLSIGGTFRKLEGSADLEDIQAQIDTSKAGKYNQFDAWTTVTEIMDAFRQISPQYNPIPELDRVLAGAHSSINKDNTIKNRLLISAVVSQMLEVLYPDNIFPEAYENAELTPITRENYRFVLEKSGTALESPHLHKNIATFYKLTDQDGKLLSEGADGKELPKPEMNEESLSVILSTAILVTEAAVTQYLVQGALLHPTEEYLPTLRKIEDIFEQPGLTDRLLDIGNTIQKSGKKFGRQHDSCAPMLDLLRKEGTPGERIIQALRDGTLEEQVKNDSKMLDAILKLREVGTLLQDTQSMTAANRHSNGLNAGLDAVIEKLHPKIYDELPRAPHTDILAIDRVPFKPIGPTEEEVMQICPVKSAVI